MYFLEGKARAFITFSLPKEPLYHNKLPSQAPIPPLPVTLQFTSLLNAFLQGLYVDTLGVKRKHLPSIQQEFCSKVEKNLKDPHLVPALPPTPPSRLLHALGQTI